VAKEDLQAVGTLAARGDCLLRDLRPAANAKVTV